MKGTNLLIGEQIINWNVVVSNRRVVVKNRSEYFGGTQYDQLIAKIKKILEDKKEIRIIELRMGSVKFVDKSSYILFETLIYMLLKEYNYKVELKIEPIIDSLYNGDMNESLICKYKNKMIDSELYIKDFEKKDITFSKYRGVLKKESSFEELTYIYTDLDSFLKNDLNDEDYRHDMAEAMAELIGNAKEHGESDCLIDLTINRDLKNKKKQGKKFLSFDIVVLNLSNIHLGDKVKEKISNEELLIKSPKTNQMLKMALENHKKHFTSDYDFEDFCNVASFQWRVSGRKKSTDNSGGTGLTTLIMNLISKAENVRCYVMSGNRVIFFKEKHLFINGDKRISFNGEKDFLDVIPNSSSISRSHYTLNGTLYNLNFITEMTGE